MKAGKSAIWPKSSPNLPPRDFSIMTLVTGNLFITGHFSGLICLWSADLGKMIDVFENAHTNQITDVVFGNIFGKDEYILANDTDSGKDHYFWTAGYSGDTTYCGLALAILLL